MLSYTGFDEIFLAKQEGISIIKHSEFSSFEAATALFVIYGLFNNRVCPYYVQKGNEGKEMVIV